MTGTQRRGSLKGYNRGGAPRGVEVVIFAASEFKVASAMTANYYRHLTVYATGD
jgi:hypothetical protein